MALCQLVDEGVYYNQRQILDDLEEKGFSRVAHQTLTKDCEACNISKFHGVYVRLPVGMAQEALTLLKARMLIAAVSIFRSGDTVVMNTSRGAAPWIADVLKETQERYMLSVMNDSDNIWILAPEGMGRNLEKRLTEIWREGPDEGTKDHPSSMAERMPTKRRKE